MTLIFSSLSILRQVDSKAFIALRSVAHIAVATLGICLYRLDGEMGGLALSLAHGLVRPVLFLLFGGTLYDSYHSRVIRRLNGLVRILPLTVSLMFVARIFNAGVPVSFNWIGEILILVGRFGMFPLSRLVLARSVVFSATYRI